MSHSIDETGLGLSVRLGWDAAPASAPWKPCRYPAWKRVAELAISAALLLLSAPAILALMALVRITSRGPALYSQLRTGRDGRPFVIYKIRTMVQDSEHRTGPRWATANDPRVTPIGEFLRRSHLDELPQLWNILRGDMSLVGPRPERPEFVAQLERAFPRYRERLAVRPGLAGLAQSQLPPDSTIEGVGHKLALDLYYLQNLGPWLDLRILACTGLFLMGVPFSCSCRLLRIPTLEMAEASSPEPGQEIDAVRVQPEPV